MNTHNIHAFMGKLRKLSSAIPAEQVLLSHNTRGIIAPDKRGTKYIVYFSYFCKRTYDMNLHEAQMQSLTFTTLLVNSADKLMIIFSYFFQETVFDISCKLPPMETLA